MMPGFIDNHANVMKGGFELQGINLREVNNETEFAQAFKDYAAAHPNQWITGGYWNEERFATKELPGKELADAFTEQQGVFVIRYDGTMALANSVALLMAGITKLTPNPPGGEIEHDKLDGEPTGILKGTAMQFVGKLIPLPGANENFESARLALAEARKFGITSIHDISDNVALKTYQVLKAKGELTARMYCRLPITNFENFVNLGIQIPFGDEWIRVGAVNGAIDGSLKTEAALFFDSYFSNPGTNGVVNDFAHDDRLQTWSLAADKARLQVSIEATGDNANNSALDIFENIARENPKWERRFRIEHAQHVADNDITRLYGLDVIASLQPYHIIDDGRFAKTLIGLERSKNVLQLKTFLEKRVKVCFGSDWPLAPLNPLLGIYAAVTRRTLDNAHPDGWFPEQKITVKEALELYTINSAFAAFEEHEKGSITVGKLADFVVLSEDLLTIDPNKIPDVNVAMTVIGGNIVYQR
ncbi:MAG: amidohydrolase, partial [Bacteroidetes bacterium]